MSLPQFKLLQPRTIAATISYLAKYAETAHQITILAGGTDLIPSMRQRLFEPEYVVDVRHLAELKGIRETDRGVEIGSLTPLTTLEHSDFLQQHYPVLTQAAAAVASPVIRNMGTIGGNICLDTRCLWYNQSLTWRKGCGFCVKKDGDICHVAPGGIKCWAVFSGDTPPALLCLDAEIELESPLGVRRMGLRDFYTGEGDRYRKLRPAELLTRVILPRSSMDYRGTYRKLRIRGSIDYPLAGVAIAVKASNGCLVDARVGLTAVNPAPVLVAEVPQILAGQPIDHELAEVVAGVAARTAKPLTTSVLTPEYRREMIRVFTKRALLELASHAGAST